MPVILAMLAFGGVGGLIYERFWRHDDVVFWICVAQLAAVAIILFVMTSESDQSA